MNLFIIYILIVLLSLLYTKWDKHSGGEISNIVILSGKTKYITNFRLLWGIHLIKKHKYKGKVYVCGKECGNYMQEYIQARVKGVTVEVVLSSNTLEDATLVRDIIKGIDTNILLVTSLSHQMRAFNTFCKVFNSSQIINSPTWYEIISWYSPFLPTGWVATLLNVSKNLMYNR